jgi:hypothetical protein
MRMTSEEIGRLIRSGRGPHRSEPGRGPLVGLYLADRADKWRGDCVLGQADGFTTIMGSTGEDFAESGWPVVVKVQREVSREDLAQHLRDLAEAVETGFFMDVERDYEGPARG